MFFRIPNPSALHLAEGIPPARLLTAGHPSCGQVLVPVPPDLGRTGTLPRNHCSDHLRTNHGLRRAPRPIARPLPDPLHQHVHARRETHLPPSRPVLARQLDPVRIRAMREQIAQAIWNGEPQLQVRKKSSISKKNLSCDDACFFISEIHCIPFTSY